jgi:hypothetical protein
MMAVAGQTDVDASREMQTDAAWTRRSSSQRRRNWCKAFGCGLWLPRLHYVGSCDDHKVGYVPKELAAMFAGRAEGQSTHNEDIFADLKLETSSLRSAKGDRGR